MDPLGKCSCLFFFLLAVYVSIESYRIGLGTLFHAEAGLFPFILGVVLGVLSAICFFTRKIPLGEAFRKTGEIVKGWKIRNSLLVIVMLLGYALLVEKLGFLLCTFGLVFSLFTIAEPKKIRIALVTATFSTLISYVIFQIVLKAHLPRGAFL